jgi:hypothetical protein
MLRRFDFNNDATLRKMEKKARHLAREARDAEGDERAALESKLDELLSEIFDYKNDRRQRSIQSKEDQLAELRSQLKKREEARGDIIADRKQELLGEGSYLEW